MKINTPTTICITLIILLSSASCGSPGNPQSNSNTPSENSVSAEPLPVEIKLVEMGSIAEYIESTGNIYAESRVTIFPKATGRVVQVNVEEGDTVKIGQVLALLEDDELKLRTQQLDILRRQAKEKLERAEELHENRMISREAYNDAVYRHEDADVAWKLARLNLDNTRIQSPIDGVVVSRKIRIGDLVSMSTPIFEIIDPKSLLIDIYLPEKEAARLQQKMPADIMPDSLPGTVFKASILRINPTIDPGTGTVKVTLVFNGDIDRLNAGMFVRARIEVDSRDTAVILPKRALIRQRDENRVFVVDDAGRAEQRSLVLGLENMHFYEVLSGLEAGEKLIMVGQHIVEDGQPVTWTEISPSPDSLSTPSAPPTDDETAA